MPTLPFLYASGYRDQLAVVQLWFNKNIYITSNFAWYLSAVYYQFPLKTINLPSQFLWRKRLSLFWNSPNRFWVIYFLTNLLYPIHALSSSEFLLEPFPNPTSSSNIGFIITQNKGPAKDSWLLLLSHTYSTIRHYPPDQLVDELLRYPYGKCLCWRDCEVIIFYSNPYNLPGSLPNSRNGRNHFLVISNAFWLLSARAGIPHITT